MSEFLHSERLRQLAGPAALVGALAVVAALTVGQVTESGPVYRWAHPETGIVYGAPMQVEYHHFFRNGKANTTPNWELRVEQCPADIAAAEQGQDTHSFNPDLNTYNPACTDTYIPVSKATYEAFPDGSVLWLIGKTGDPVRR
ncbi:MAG TPA: hypothetical protein VLI54_06870 [Bacillota bacterium]|nr:hypothetical protein [Bacillota bacterium]